MARRHNVPDLSTYYLRQMAGPGEETEVSREDGVSYRTHPMHLDSSELALFDLWAVENVRIGGTEIRYYPLDKSSSVRDPLYGEPKTLSYRGPSRIFALFSEFETTQEMRDEGYYSEVNASLWIPRAEIERAGMAPPAVSDIVEVWDLPYFAMYKAGRTIIEAEAGRGLFFDVIGIREDGFLADTSSFVGFVCTLRRVSYMPPERKLDLPKTEDEVCP